jgi:hypothetical protein
VELIRSRGAALHRSRPSQTQLGWNACYCGEVETPSPESVKRGFGR